MPVWNDAYGTAVWWAAGVSVGSLVAGLLAIRIFVVRIPPDHFAAERRAVARPADRHRIRGALLRFGRNVLGCILIAAGVAMIVLPGQGVLTILIGVMFVDFPGKLRLERWLVSRRPVLQSINLMRRRAGRPPLVLEG